MDKTTFDKIKKYAMQCSVSIVGNMVPVYDGSNIMPDELGWANEKGVYINYKHPMLDDLDYNNQIVFLLGVIAHELMHKVYSDFDVLKYGLAKYKNDSLTQRMVMEIANLIEDPAIEYMAQFKIGGYLLKCLRYTVKVLYNESPSLEKISHPLSQLMTAYICYGDMGIIKGEFTFKEAKEAFIETLPIMDKAIDSFSAKNRFMAAEKVVEIIKKYIDINDENEAENAMDDFNEQMSQSGRSMSPQGKGAAKEELDEEENQNSSSVEEKKRSNRRTTSKQLQKKSTSEKGEDEKSENKNGSSSSNQSDDDSSKQGQSGSDDKESKDEHNDSSQKKDEGNDDNSNNSNENENGQDNSSSDSESKDNESTNSDTDSNSNSDGDTNEGEDSDSNSENEIDMNNLPESQRQKITGESHDITSADGKGLEEGETTFDEEIYDISEEDIKAILDEIKELSDDEDTSAYEGDLDEFTDISEEVKEFKLKVENKLMEVGDIPTVQAIYYDVLNEVGVYIGNLHRSLKKIFRQDVEYREYTTTGGVSMKRLASGRQTARVFERKRLPKNKQQMKVCILVDESGSMHQENKAIVAKKTAIILAEVFGKLDIPITVMGFTTGLRGYQVNHHHYIHWDNSPINRLKLLNISAHGGNYDAFAVRTAAAMMKKKKSVYDLLIVISDGEPSFGLGKRGERLTDLSNAVHQARKQVKNIIGIGLGSINTTTFEKFYGNDFIHVPNIKELPIELTNAIKRIVKKW